MSTTDVLVVGAGPAGMALSMELSIQGVQFRVVDKAPERSDKSRALGVHPRTLEVLNRYSDSIDELLSKANRIAGNAMWVGGKCFAGFDNSFQAAKNQIRDTQFPGLFVISQVNTEDYLMKHLEERGVAVERPVTVKSVKQDDHGVTVVLAKHDGSEEVVRCKYVVGCDGAHSVVRHAMSVEFEGDAYPQEFVLADTLCDWDETAGKAHMFLGEGMAMILPMGPGRARILASRPRHLSADADPTLQDFEDFLHTMLPADESVSKPKLHDPFWISRFHLHHRCATKYRDGKLFVAGDAAHIHSPIGGQGMNTGIQDAVNLGWKLARVLEGQQPDSFLDTYNEERWPVGQHLLQKTDQLFTFISSNNKGFTLMRNLLLPYALPSMTSTSDMGLKMLKYFSQLGVKYQRSSIVHTADNFAGPVRGGFRAPDGKIWTSDGKETWIQNLFKGPGYHLLLFAATEDGKDVAGLQQKLSGVTKDARVHVIDAVDFNRETRKQYGFESKSGYAYVRPDGYLESIGYLESFDELLEELKA